MMKTLISPTPCSDVLTLAYDRAESLALTAIVSVFPFKVVVKFVTSGPLAMLKGALLIFAKYVRGFTFLGSMELSKVLQSW